MASKGDGVESGGRIPVTRAVEPLADPGGLAHPTPAFAETLRQLVLHGASLGGSVELGLRALFAHLPIVVYGVDEHGVMTACFGGGLARLGLDDDELVGVPTEAFGEPAAALTERVLGGEPASALIEGDGALGPFRFQSFAAPLDDGTGYLAVAIDVTDQALAEWAAAEQSTRHQATLAALRGSEERFETVSQNVPIGVFLTDTDGHVTYANPELLRILGRSDAGLAEVESFHSLIHPDDLPEAVVALDRHTRSGESGIFQCRVRRPDDDTVKVRIRLVTLTDDDGERVGMVGSVADITEFVAADERLREREERTRAILENAGEAIVSFGEAGVIFEFNAAAERMFGYDSDEVIGRMVWTDLLAQPHRGYFETRVRAYVDGHRESVGLDRSAELQGVRKDGSHVPMEAALTEVRAGGQRLFTAIMRDLTERQILERELERRSTYDDLTGLPNRVLLYGQLEMALARANRHDTSVAVLFVDIDRFKLVTESLGHRAGDELVVQVARRLEGAVPEDAAITRFSSDQFVIYVEDLSTISEAVDVASTIVEAINEPFEVAGDEAFVGATVGIAFASNGMGTAETLVNNAGVAMSRAKEHSVTRYEVFDAEMRAKVDSIRRLEIAMRHGLDRHEFELHYQPVVWLHTGEVRGVEALVRWNHPRLGFLPPGEFISVAEDSGLILRLGEWIFEEACRQQAMWARQFPETPLLMSINLSGRQLVQPGLAELLRAAIARTGADPRSIACEITETMILHDVETAGATLHELKQIGVRLALDDFGTGYSSLSYLCRFPIDVLKIDRSFVSQLGTATPDASIVEMVVNLARTMQLDVIAEGVETEIQVRHLKALGCPLAQGYLFSRPVTAAGIEAMVMGVDHDGLFDELVDDEVIDLDQLPPVASAGQPEPG